MSLCCGQYTDPENWKDDKLIRFGMTKKKVTIKRSPAAVKKLFEKARGVKLDVGCGIHKQKGFLGMDMVPHPHVDIVHDIQQFPWPIPDNSCHQVLLSHIWEHLEPKYRFQVMDEVWRICRHDGQLWLSCPYAGSYLEAAHPAHYMCPNEATFQFFDPAYMLWHSCSYKKPQPWHIAICRWSMHGCIEIIFEPCKTKDGKPILLPKPGEQKKDDMVTVEKAKVMYG